MVTIRKFACLTILVFCVSCYSDSMFIPTLDCDAYSLAERRLMRGGEPTLPNVRFYPPGYVIKEIDIVKEKMDLAWNEMLEGCNQYNRFECGFCIYINNNGQIYLGNMQYGPKIANLPECTGEMNLVIDKNPNDLCAIFHTHTSFRYLPSYCYRTTGPSGADSTSANNLNVPSLVYDYDASQVWGQITYSNHHVYLCGPNQRPPAMP